MAEMGVAPAKKRRMDSRGERLQEVLENWRKQSRQPSRSTIHIWEPDTTTMVRAGALDTLEACVGLGMDINACDEMGKTCLHVAVSAGNEEAVEKLLHLGADPNAHALLGDSPLHTALSPVRGTRIVDLLVHHGSDRLCPSSLGVCAWKTGFANAILNEVPSPEPIHASTSPDSTEVCGAYLCLHGDLPSARWYWHTAMRRRWNPPIIETKQPPAKSISSLLGVKEPLTIAEMEHFSTASRETMQDVAYLICERVFGETWATFFLLLQCVERKTAAGLAPTSLKLLDHCCQMELGPTVQSIAVRNVYDAYVVALYTCQCNSQTVTFSDLTSVMSFSLSQLDGLLSLSYFRKQLALRSHPAGRTCDCTVCSTVKPAVQGVLTVLTWLTSLLHQATEQEKARYGEFVRTLVCLDLRIHGGGILHLMPDHLTQEGSLNSLETDAAYGGAVQYIIVCSALVHGPTKGRDHLYLCKDHAGRTPLHLLRKKFTEKKEDFEKTVQCFIDHGAHPCTRDDFGVSAHDMLRDPSAPTCVLPLACVAAKTCLRVQDRERLEGQAPMEVVDFLKDH